jgi:predicted dehydrogenase
VGIVGASPQSWAAAAHLPALAHLDELTVTAVATTRKDSARAAASTFGVRHAFASAEELASDPEVDLVVASVKVPAHAAVIRAALAAGKHVYAEWPLGVDLAEASALADAAAAAGVVHAVNLQAYHSPGARFVADLLADGRIGPVQSVSMTAAGDPLGGSRIPRSLAWSTEPAAGVVHAVNLQAYHSPGARFVADLLAGGRIGPVESVSMTAAGDPLGGSRIPRSLAWSTEPAAGNNLLTVKAGHALAALERVAGPLADVSAVLANLHDRVTVAETGELIANHVPGQVALHGRLGSGALLSLSIHGGSAAAPGGFAITITGTDGTLTITPADPGHYPGWAEWRVRLRGTDGAAADLPVPGRYRLVPAGVPAGPAAHIAALYREIAQAITEGRPAHPGFDTAVHHHQTLAAIERAAQTGVRQPLAPPAGPRQTPAARDHTGGKVA